MKLELGYVNRRRWSWTQKEGKIQIRNNDHNPKKHWPKWGDRDSQAGAGSEGAEVPFYGKVDLYLLIINGLMEARRPPAGRSIPPDRGGEAPGLGLWSIYRYKWTNTGLIW